MSFSKISTLSGLIALASQAAAHGLVTGIVADGIYYPGYDMNSQYETNPAPSVGWSIPGDLERGPITPQSYNSSDIICHLNATNAQVSAPVAAGGSVDLQWTAWPSSHHGPVIDYLADCGGDCTTVDKTTLKWFKIDGVGLIDDSVIPGTWADDQLIASNNTWTVKIPSDIASGNYVLRHEIIALHSAGEANGAQNYPQCVNLQVTGTGTSSPEGTVGTELYTATDPGILINIYVAITSYVVPGPALYSGAESASQATGSSTVVSGVAATSVAAETTATAAMSSAVVTSAPVVTAAPYSNSTMVTSSKKSKTACKAKTSKALTAASSKTKSATVVTTTAAEKSYPAESSSAVLTTSAASVTIATTSSPIEASATTTSTASSGNTKSAVAEPTGTTLGDLLSWLSSFYTKHTDTTYDNNTVARRHARDIAQRDMDKFDGEHEHATGGVAKATGVHHAKPSGTGHGHAKPTGTWVAGAPMPTNARHFQHAGN